MSILPFKARSLILAAAFAFPGIAQALPNDCAARGPADPDCGQHNMMLVGQRTVFASHLPMFNSKHRFQFIAEMDLARGSTNLNALYTDDRARNSRVRMYTLEPQQIFVLRRLFKAEDAGNPVAFRAKIFRGHLERGGTALAPLSNVDAHVRRVIYAREIGPAGPSVPAELTYILFGNSTEMFAAHQITRAPDFDQLLGVGVTGHTFTPEEMAKGVLVSIPGRPNSAARRLRAGETIAASARIGGAGAGVPVKLTVAAEPYFEQGELEGAFNPEPTPLEIEAGFGG